MEPIDTLTRHWAAMDDRTRKEAIGSFVGYVLITALGFRSLKRTPPEVLRGPRAMWKGIMPVSISRISPEQAWVIPLGTLLFWILGRRRRPTT